MFFFLKRFTYFHCKDTFTERRKNREKDLPSVCSLPYHLQWPGQTWSEASIQEILMGLPHASRVPRLWDFLWCFPSSKVDESGAGRAWTSAHIVWVLWPVDQLMEPSCQPQSICSLHKFNRLSKILFYVAILLFLLLFFHSHLFLPVRRFLFFFSLLDFAWLS